jgi:hypothetical protein
MGHAKQIFVGTLLTNLVKSYFLYATPKEYKPLVLIIDEAHNFVSPAFTIITKQARKYKIAVILATTDFSMMPKPLIHSLLSNSGTLVCLKAGYVEAQMIANEIPGFKAEDIQGLEKYHAAYKIPDGAGIVKLPRPIYVKQIEVKPRETKKRTFGITWFDLPSYSFQLDYDPDGRVAGDGHREGPETPPR